MAMTVQCKVRYTLLLTVFLTQAAAAQALKIDALVPLSGKAAKFDFMAADEDNHRILAAHKEAGTLEILDLKTGQVLAPISVGEAQGVAVDGKNHRYFTGNDGEHTVSVIDSQTLKKSKDIKVEDAVDAIAFDSAHGFIYAAEDDGKRLWVIDPSKASVVTTIKIPGSPEVLEYNARLDRVFLNIKDKDSVVVINPLSYKVEATWSTLPAKSPHGLALDIERSRLYIGGRNGKMVALDAKTGKVVSSADIVAGTDQIVFDAGLQLIYSASGGGHGNKPEISVTKTTDQGLIAQKGVASVAGAHTLALDVVSHDIWISAADAKQSFLQKFKFVP